MKLFLPFLSLCLFLSGCSNEESKFMDEQKEMSKRCPDCGCSLLPPWTLIRGGLADDRFQEFETKVTNCQLKNCARKVEYKPEGALNLLDTLTYIKDKYDGFRAYYAMYPSQPGGDSGYQHMPKGQDGKLTIIYVPTFKDPGGNRKRHPDDTTHCMIIKDSVIEKIEPKYATLWIKKADAQVLSKLEANQRKNDNDTSFQETRSLWFKMTYIKSTLLKNGLIDVLRCRTCCKNLKSVQAKFAAFPKKNLTGHKHQLSLVFMLVSQKGEAFFSLAYEDDPTDPNGTDTGKPCPPPNPCTEVGSLLP